MSDVCKFWGMLAIFGGAAFMVVATITGSLPMGQILIIGWCFVASGLVLILLSRISDALMRIADLQVSPENRFGVTRDPRRLMTRMVARPEPEFKGRPAESRRAV